MTEHNYKKGRLNLPFVGICTFGKYPYQPDWDKIEADIAILGAPTSSGVFILLVEFLVLGLFVF